MVPLYRGHVDASCARTWTNTLKGCTSRKFKRQRLDRHRRYHLRLKRTHGDNGSCNAYDCSGVTDTHEGTKRYEIFSTGGMREAWLRERRRALLNNTWRVIIPVIDPR
jgi:hypothetical protein